MDFNKKLNELAQSLKNSNEYIEFINLKNEVKKDENAFNMLKEFKSKQKSQQLKYLNGSETSKSEETELQNLYSILVQNENIRKMLECEMKINIYLANVQKVMGDAIKEIVDF